MPLYRRRTATERAKARRYERIYNRRASMHPKHRLTVGPISVATKRARQKLKLKGFYKTIGKMREEYDLPPFTIGEVAADPRVIAAILEASSAATDPEAFAQGYVAGAPEYLGTAIGLSAMQFEAWVAENGDLADKFVETVVETDRGTFIAMFQGRFTEADWTALDKIDFLALRALLEAGDQSYETGMTSDITVFECSTDLSAFVDDGEMERFDPAEIRQQGGLAQEAFEFLAQRSAPMVEGATVDAVGSKWKLEGGRWFVVEATHKTFHAHFEGPDEKDKTKTRTATKMFTARDHADATMAAEHHLKLHGLHKKGWKVTKVAHSFTVKEGEEVPEDLDELTCDEATRQEFHAAMKASSSYQEHNTKAKESNKKIAALHRHNVVHQQANAHTGTAVEYGNEATKSNSPTKHFAAHSAHIVAASKTHGELHSHHIQAANHHFAAGGHAQEVSRKVGHVGGVGHGYGHQTEGTAAQEAPTLKWSKKVQTHYHPPEGLFLKDGAAIARQLLKDSDGKAQAMERLNFYINRAGSSVSNKAELEKAKAIISKAVDETTTSGMVGGFSADVLGSVARSRQLLKKKKAKQNG